jgi:hypothetical protein
MTIVSTALPTVGAALPGYQAHAQVGAHLDGVEQSSLSMPETGVLL